MRHCLARRAERAALELRHVVCVRVCVSGRRRGVVRCRGGQTRSECLYVGGTRNLKSNNTLPKRVDSDPWFEARAGLVLAFGGISLITDTTPGPVQFVPGARTGPDNIGLRFDPSSVRLPCSTARPHTHMSGSLDHGEEDWPVCLRLGQGFPRRMHIDWTPMHTCCRGERGSIARRRAIGGQDSSPLSRPGGVATICAPINSFPIVSQSLIDALPRNPSSGTFPGYPFSKHHCGGRRDAPFVSRESRAAVCPSVQMNFWTACGLSHNYIWAC